MKLLPLLVSTACFATIATAQTKRGVFLLDRSGSMSVNGGGGTRLAKSLLAIDDELDQFFSGNQPTEALVASFNSNGYTILGGGWHTTGVAAKAAAAGSTTLSGSTPLADAICESIAHLQTRVFAGGAQLFCENSLYVYSDGGENNSTGACSGVDDVNASNGRCPLDFVNTFGTVPYSGASWQNNTCANIAGMTSFPTTTCLFSSGLVFGRLFNSVTDNPTESEVFQLLRSLAGQTGASVLQITDNDPYIPGSVSAINVIPMGCQAPNGEMPVVEASSVPQIGTSLSLQLRGTTLPLPMLLVGFSLQQPPLPLAALGAPQCVLGVNFTISHIGTFLPIAIPNDPSLVNLEMFAQGLATSVSLNPIVTSHAVGLRILP